jgi:dTDP-4-amino-4,6-dideoxygalactose transaminase
MADTEPQVRPSLPFLPFARPEIDDAEIDAVVRCMRSGWITTGPLSLAFEQAFARYLDAPLHCVAVNSATAGLHLALDALRLQAGDEVIVPTLTFTATAEVVRYLGATPVFVDIDEATCNLDLGAVRRAIGARTRAIIPVHFAGLPCPMEGLLALAREHGLHVVEDAAHAFPAHSGGKLVGTLGSDVTVFSFYANKTMTTGEGGMAVTRDAGLARRMRLMRLHGISQDAFERYRARTPSWQYDVVAPGYKYNLTDIAAAIGIEQLKKIDRFAARRQQLARQYDEALGGLPLRLPATPLAGDSHAWHLYVVRVLPHARLSRDQLIEQLCERGIGTSVHFIPLHRQPYWRDQYHLRPRDFPNAELAYPRLLSLPLYSSLSDAEQLRVCDALRELLS